MTPLTKVSLDDRALAAAAEVLRSGMLVQGAQVAAFEAALCARTGRRHAVAVSSGTSALSLALSALDVGVGDEVLCPALTWPSPAHAILGAGATPVLVDVHARQWNVTAEALQAARSPATRAAIVIDQFGNPADHHALAEALGDLPVLVDAACALGSRLHDAPCGSHGRIACLSFHPRKLLTTGEGGACLTDDDALAARLCTLRNHGQRAPGQFDCAAGNHRMTELAAAIGLAQLHTFDARLARLRVLAARYRERLGPARLQEPLAGATPNHQTLGVLVGRPGDGPSVRDACLAALHEADIGAGRLSYALQTLPHLAATAALAGERGLDLSRSADVAARGIALPLFAEMEETDVDRVVAALERAPGGGAP